MSTRKKPGARGRGRAEKRAQATALNDIGWTTFSGGDSDAPPASQQQALGIPAYYGCVRVLSDDVSNLPPVAYRRRAGVDVAIESPVVELLESPNTIQGGTSFTKLLMTAALGWGNGYAEIVRNGAGVPVQLWPVETERVSPRWVDDSTLVYQVRQPQGGVSNVPSEDMIHVRGPGDDPVLGWSPIQLFRATISKASGEIQFGAAFYRNGAAPGIALKYPNRLTPEALKNLKADWRQNHEGATKAHRLVVLEEGASIERLAVNPDDAQFVESAELSGEDVCRIFRVPPHKVHYLRRATFSNIEQQDLEYAKYTLLTWCKLIEEQLDRKVAPAFGRGVRVRLDMSAVLRGDQKSRYESYKSAIDAGWMNRNEARAREGLTPVEGGDVYYRPLNMTPLESEPAAPEPSSSGEPAGLDAGTGDGGAVDPKAVRAALAAATGAVADGLCRRSIRGVVAAASGRADVDTALRQHVERVGRELGDGCRHVCTSLGIDPGPIVAALSDAAEGQAGYMRSELRCRGPEAMETLAEPMAAGLVQAVTSSAIQHQRKALCA